MENSAPTFAAATWLGRISVHQDFVWFCSLVLWSFALIVWWRQSVRRQTWLWLPGAAFASIATALIQFAMFNPTFDIFQARLIPGTVSTYKPALIEPYWLGDVMIGLGLAVMVAAWGWLAARRASHLGRGALWVLLLVFVAGLQAVDPFRGGGMLAVLSVIGAATLWPLTAAERWSRTGLVLGSLLPVLSTVGPLAVGLGMLQRNGPPTPLGLGVAFFQLVFGAAMLAGLLRGVWGRLPVETHAALRHDTRWFGAGAAVWLAAGLVFGIQIGRDNREEIQQNRLRTTAAHALVFNPALLAPLLAPEFQITRKSAAGEPAPAESAWLASGVAAATHRQLREVVVATPFLVEARILLLHDGWLVSALTSDRAPGPVEWLRRATPDDLARWARKEPYVEDSPVPEIGYHYYCRAPILAPDGRMLAWLDNVRSEYYLSVARRWRAAPLLITALGLGVLALMVVQRQSTRERETARRAAAVATEGSRIKTTFLANVSHELRTPLQSILGYSELLQQELGDAHHPRLAALRQQGELMTRLVNDLIDLSAVESGLFQCSTRAVAPAEIVRQTVESLRPHAAGKGLTLQTVLADAVPAWVEADDNRLRQVLLNLTGNAIKFTDRGAVTVTLRAAPGPAGQHRLTLAVQDTGPGIPPAQQARLFTPFTRLDRTAGKEGSGLGLAVAAALCRAMGGDLTVSSDGVHGSCFTATLLVAATTPPVAGRAPVQPSPRIAPRVLVVDDNPLVRELFVAALTERGAVCQSAATGTAALAGLAGAATDVVVLDLALPDGDGAGFVRQFRALAPGLRIVGASAHAADADRTRALAAGMDEFLVKPIPLEQLWAAVAGLSSSEPATGKAAAGPGRELLALFARDLPARRAELAGAVQAADWVRVRALAHYLRNSALVVQAHDLLAACTGLEDAATAGDAAGATHGWARCAAALDAWVAGHRA